MGQVGSMPMQMPAGATTWVIEGQTGCEGCKGREWMHPMKPAFVRMSDSAWSQFNTTIATSCAQYKKEGLGAIIMMFGILGGLCASTTSSPCSVLPPTAFSLLT